ncbi:MAG: FlgO family outer membrane protein [Desulfobulbaceae bacterium]|nr:FlgO family outer membrane protein [Desulfobulbaceae bacterium]
MSAKLILLLLLAAIPLAGCAKINNHFIRDNKEHDQTDTAFREHWWNYYERGRSFADNGLYREAARDFHKAIEGRDRDQRETRMDNLRHAAGYFPHRELGVVYFKRKLYDQAISELELSLQSTPSAKTHYYLNKARTAKIRQEQRDMFPPELHLQGSSTTKTTNSFTHVIKGVAVDDTYLASIQIGDRRVPLELAARQHVFTAEIPLKQGENTIRMVVTDLAGKTTDQNLEIFCDRSGPLMEIMEIENNADTRIVRGIVSDEGGLKSLKLNGSPWKISGRSTAYNFKFSLPEGGAVLAAEDRSGNITSAALTEDKAGYDPLLHPFDADLELDPPSRPEEPAATAADMLLSAPGEASPTDEDSPIITLKSSGPNQVTYEDSFLLEGTIVDSSPVNSFSINGDPVPIKNGRQLYFSQRQQLDRGDNGFVVAAVDIHGNRSEKTITIHRKIQNIRQISSRLAVAVSPVEYVGEATHPVELVRERMIDSFRQQQRFNIVKQQSAHLSAPAEAGESDKSTAADAVLAGTIIETADSLEIIARLIDAETSAVLAANDIFSEDKSFSSLTGMLDNLAARFTRDFPVLHGMLTDVGENEVTINIGADKHIEPGMLMICYRDGLQIRHPVTGRIVGGEPEILGEIRVKEVLADSSKASLRKQHGKIKVYDRVIGK